MSKGKKRRKKGGFPLGEAGAVVALLAIAAFVYLRFVAVPEAPEAGEGNFFVTKDLSAAFIGNGCAVAILSVDPGEDALSSASDLTAHARRFDVAVLPSCGENSLELARRFLAAATVRTLILPRKTPSKFIKEISEKYPDLSVMKMPWRKAVNVGEFQLYDLGKGDAMALRVRHGKDVLLFAASAAGGTYDAAFASADAIAKSTFTSGEAFTTVKDAQAPKVKVLSVIVPDATESFVFDGEGGVGRISLLTN